MKTSQASRSKARWVWLIPAAGLLLFSGIYSYLAPFGGWENRIFEVPVWKETDPSGPYIAAAHEFAWGETPSFLGHPGSTLLLLLEGVQYAYYALGDSAGFSFTQFTARNLPTVVLLSKLLMTVLHLVSFFAVFVFAKQLVGSRRAACLASLGYATSFPVLYFLSRVSVEPLMVIFFIASFLAIWRFQELAAEGRDGAALGFVGLAAVAAACGALTKFSFLGPLPLFLLLYLLAGLRPQPRAPIAARTSKLALLVFCGVSAAAALLSTQFVDWQIFFGFWHGTTQRELPSFRWIPLGLLPGLQPDRIFLLTELVFISLGAIGGVAFTRRASPGRSRALWASAYAGYALLIWGYRCSTVGSLLPFHYFFLTQVLVAVFFGYFGELALRRLPKRSTSRRLAFLGLAAVVVGHAIGILAVVDSRRHDVAMYAPNRAIYALISQLSPSQRLGIDRRSLPKVRRLHGLGVPYVLKETVLLEEFRRIFAPADMDSIPSDARRLFVPALGTHVAVVEGRPGPKATEDSARGPLLELKKQAR